MATPRRTRSNVEKSAPRSHGSLTDAVTASGQVRCTAWCIVSTPACSHCIDPRPRGRRVGDHLLTGGPVAPRVVEDAVVAGVGAGEDRRVVGERHRRQRRHRAVLEGGAHRHEAGDVRRLAPVGHVVEDVRVAPVEQEPDDVVGRGRRRAGRRAPRRPGATGNRPSSIGATPISAATVGATSTSRHARRHAAQRADAGAADHERRPRLHDVERAVLAAVAALVLPVVGGGVDHAEVGRGRMVEELRHLLVGERVAVRGAVRVAHAQLVGAAARSGRSPGPPAGCGRRPARRCRRFVNRTRPSARVRLVRVAVARRAPSRRSARARGRARRSRARSTLTGARSSARSSVPPRSLGRATRRRRHRTAGPT